MECTISNKIYLSGIKGNLYQDLSHRLTLDNPKYVEAEKFNRSTMNLEPELKFYELSNGNTLILPRGAMRGVLATAEEHGEVEIIDSRLSLPEIYFRFSGTLRPYQRQAIQDILLKPFGVLEAGTGAGKTVMALSIIANRKQPTLILVHTKELMYQWKEQIKTFLNVNAGLVGAGKFDIQPITVAIVNTARKNLDNLPQYFGNLVVDECHRVPSSLFSETVSAFSSEYMLGLSATPYRRDGLDELIGWFVGLHKVTVDTSVLHDIGAILRPKIIRRETLFQYPYADDYQQMISALVSDDQRNRLIACDIRVQSARKSGLSLVVSDRVDHLKELASLTGVGTLLTGKTPAKKRKEIVQALTSGAVRVLFSTLSLIGEGFDCPGMDALFLTTPIKFSGRLTQVVGRVLRPAAGKEPLVYDYTDSNVGLLKHQAKQRQNVFALL